MCTKVTRDTPIGVSNSTHGESIRNASLVSEELSRKSDPKAHGGDRLGAFLIEQGLAHLVAGVWDQAPQCPPLRSPGHVCRWNIYIEEYQQEEGDEAEIAYSKRKIWRLQRVNLTRGRLT